MSSMTLKHLSFIDAWEQVLSTVCVSGLVPVSIPHHGREYFYVLGGGLQSGTLYRAEVYGQILNYILSDTTLTLQYHFDYISNDMSHRIFSTRWWCYIYRVGGFFWLYRMPVCDISQKP